MTLPCLHRSGGAAPPPRLLHVGLGNFFRAHQCWYTAHATDQAQWGIAAFTGRGSEALVRALAEQDGCYTLVTRGPEADRFETVPSIVAAHIAADHERWLERWADPVLAGVTSTVTEAAYLRRIDGGLDAGRPEVQADVAALRGNLRASVRTVPARLVAGLAARRAVDGGPVALIPCDNMSENGAAVRRVVLELAELVEPALAEWITRSAMTVTTMVDRITPRTTASDERTVRAAIGREDRVPVVTEPFSEWVLSGAFPGGRPVWEAAGATFTDDVTPFEQRKLWLLNGGHSLLAYAGSIRGHETVADAVADDACRGWLEQWWAEAGAHLPQADAELSAYRTALLERFANPRMRHLLAQVVADGSQKLPIRTLPVLRAERAAGRMPEGALTTLAAWICHLRGAGAPVTDARADEVVAAAHGELRDAVPRALATLDPQLLDDAAVVAAVTERCRGLERASPVIS